MRYYLFYIAFVEGMLVLATELLGGAVIVPYYGNGLTVWTFVLGITMFSLATGYWAGGWLVKKIEPLRAIGILLPLIIIFINFIPSIAFWAFQENTKINFEWLILRGLLPVFFIPLLLLGILSTVIVQGVSNTGVNSGNASSKVYGISTISAIITAISIGLYFLESMQLKTSIFIFSLIGIFGAILLPQTKLWSSLRLFSMLTVPLLLLFYISGNQIGIKNDSRTQTLYKNNGILGEVKITYDIPSKTKALYVNNSLQSTLGDNGYASLPYVKFICYFLSHRSKTDKVLLAGLGGGNIIRDLHSMGFPVDIIELDERVVNASVKYFGLDLKGTRLVIDDARHYINTSKNKYDIIVLDLSLGETIPSNVYTLESFQKMNQLLNENGIIVLHLFSSEKGSSINSIRSLGRTMQEAGLKVNLLNTQIEPVLPSPYIYIASKKILDFNTNTYSLYNASGNRIFPGSNSDLRNFDFKEGLILTDDRPMLEVYQKDIVSYFRKSYIRESKKRMK